MPLNRVAVAAGIGLAVVSLVLVFALHRGDAGTGAAARPTSTPVASCQTRLLRDWSDGRIDAVYPLACYRAAIRSLPADLKVYSSAPDDIAQALSQRIVQSHHQKISGHQGRTSLRKIASAP